MRIAKNAVVGLIMLLGLAGPLVLPASVQAVDPENVFEGVCQDPAAQSSPACQTESGDPLTGSEGIIFRVAQVVAIVTGVAAVLMIIVGGFMYVTAGGDSSKTSNAKKTIIYAIVGLLVVVFAQTIITLILNRI